MDGFASAPAALSEGLGGGCRPDQLQDGRGKLWAAHLPDHLKDSQRIYLRPDPLHFPQREDDISVFENSPRQHADKYISLHDIIHSYCIYIFKRE